MNTLDELVTPLTSAEAETAIYSALAARGVTTTTWKPGAVVRTIIAGVAIVLAALSELQALLAQSAFLDFAEGAWLTLVARYFYETERGLGTFAAGNVTLNNSAGGVFSVAVGDLIVANGTSGKAYRNTAAFSIAAMQTGVIVPVEAVEIGSGSSSAAGTVTTMVTTMTGVSCTNAGALIGLDEDSDATLRSRCRSKWSTLGTGSTAPAFEYYARAASSEVVRVSVREHDNLGVSADGHVTVILATASGAVSAAAIAAVAAYIETKRPLCRTVHVASAVAFSVPVVGTLTARIGTGVAALATATANLATLQADARIGETVYRPALFEQLMEPAGMVNVTLSQPTTDIPLAWNEVPVFTPSLAYTEIP